MELLRQAIEHELRVHPRVAQQKLAVGPEARASLLHALPELVPFRDATPLRLVALLDWDHRLPSQRLVLRLHLAYDEVSAGAFEEAFAERVQAIAGRDLFPEFDVPDYDELPADESYEVELSPGLSVEAMRLVSPWRREVSPLLGERAVALVRSSPHFAKVRSADPMRPQHLGDLDPVAWVPPCESSHARWTIDVWWLTAFDGRMGSGWSFLVDLSGEATVVAHREFTVRAG